MTSPADCASRAFARRVRFAGIALAVLIAAMAAGCVYRINIQQGNFLDPKAVEQLSVGMTRSQVRYLLGTPEVPNAFDRDRWDYFFYYKHGRTRKAEQAQISVYFEDDKVARIERPRGSDKVATTTPTEPVDVKEPKEALPPPPEAPSSTREQLPPPPESPPPAESRSEPPASDSAPAAPSDMPAASDPSEASPSEPSGSSADAPSIPQPSEPPQASTL
jgi:outer membrane protein assembly factor BamE